MRRYNVTCRMKPYIKPFEKVLAIRELESLSEGKAQTRTGVDSPLEFTVSSQIPAQILANNLAYWETVKDSQELVTQQVKYEKTSLVGRNGVELKDLLCTLPLLADSPNHNRRCLRYATHGIHEYRGKFFPQLVRSLMNHAKVPQGGTVVDPMCGSGTTLVEATITGRSSYGLDINPLSAFVTHVKCSLLSECPDKLVEYYLRTSKRLKPTLQKSKAHDFNLQQLPKDDQVYLQRWFSRHTQNEIGDLMAFINTIKGGTLRSFYRVVLSNILRCLSWQKEDDLRVRKEEKRIPSGEVARLFLKELERSTKDVVSFLCHRGNKKTGKFKVHEGDARNCTSNTLKAISGKVDAVITSPPYGTALPYLDTDRLSLIYLGLLSRSKHRERDKMMIGNREITERVRLKYWEKFKKNRSQLPNSTCQLIERIDELNRNDDVGFRRKNLSALLSQYFFDMRMVLEQIQTLTKPNGKVYIVVGNNRTTAGGKKIEIKTASHLADIAELVGLRVQERINMDMLVSRDIFRKNAVRSEEVLILDKR